MDSLQLSRRKSRENKCHNRQESVVDLVEGVQLKGGGEVQALRSETSRGVFVTVAHLSNKTFFFCILILFSTFSSGVASSSKKPATERQGSGPDKSQALQQHAKEKGGVEMYAAIFDGSLRMIYRDQTPIVLMKINNYKP